MEAGLYYIKCHWISGVIELNGSGMFRHLAGGTGWMPFVKLPPPDQAEEFYPVVFAMANTPGKINSVPRMQEPIMEPMGSRAVKEQKLVEDSQQRLLLADTILEQVASVLMTGSYEESPLVNKTDLLRGQIPKLIQERLCQPSNAFVKCQDVRFPAIFDDKIRLTPAPGATSPPSASPTN